MDKTAAMGKIEGVRARLANHGWRLCRHAGVVKVAVRSQVGSCSVGFGGVASAGTESHDRDYVRPSDETKTRAPTSQ